MSDPAWDETLVSAIQAGNTQFTISLDGVEDSSTYFQIISAAQRGASGMGGNFDWEMAQMYQGGQLANATLMRTGQIVVNPFK